MKHGVPYPVGSRNKKQPINFSRVAGVAAVGVMVFASGIWVGQGRLLEYSGKQTQVSSTVPNDLNYESVEAAYDKLRLGFDGQLDEEKLLDGLKKGLAQATGDPYTEYFTASEAEEFSGELNGTFSGIGAELGKDDQGNVIVIAPLSGYPAERAGLKTGDIIIQVDDVAVTGLSVSEAVSKIRGPIDSTVTLKIVRDKSETLSFEIVREEIKVPSVESSILEGNIGYLRISRFSDDTVQLSRHAVQSFVDTGVRGVILDLRSNPGGLLTASVDVSSFWLDSSEVVLQEKRDGSVVQTYSARGEPILKGLKTVVLINEGSASASEITAAALRDNNVATIIGTRSYGKGSVQRLDELRDGGMLKITIAHWYTPSGDGIDGVGIEPDQTVEVSDEDAEAGNDTQKQAAIDFINQ